MWKYLLAWFIGFIMGGITVQGIYTKFIGGKQ